MPGFACAPSSAWRWSAARHDRHASPRGARVRAAERMSRAAIVRILLIALIATAVGLAIAFSGSLSSEALEAWLQDFGIWAPIVFMAIYAVAAVCCLPALLFTIAAGALFGPVLGTVYSLIGATAGATIAFLIARYALSDWIRRRAGGRLTRVIEGVEQEGWRFVAMTRLIPFIPFTLLNYVLGLTRVPVAKYVLASAVFMTPGAAAYAYLGYAGREVATGSEGLIEKGLLGLAVLGLIAFLPRLIKRFRRKGGEPA